MASSTPLSASRRLRRAEASLYLLENFGISRTPATLAKLASSAGTTEGPRYVIAGGLALYDAADLDDWAASLITAPMRSVKGER